MKKAKIGVISIFVLSLIVMLAGIFLPGIMLHSNINIMADKVVVVPQKYYAASNSAMAKSNSKRMKTSEKIQLITGTWESTIQEANKYEMEMKDYEAVTLAQSSIEELYEAKLYPSLISTEYGSWYSWTAKSYKAIDSIFNTYTSYYWVINFTKYDGTERHEIYMLEDGTILCCVADYNEEVDVNGIENAFDILSSQGLDVYAKDTKEISIQELIKYPLAIDDFEDIKRKTSCNIRKDEEEYNIVQAYSDNCYFYQVTDAKPENN